MAKPSEQTTVAERPPSFEALNDMGTNRFVRSPSHRGSNPPTTRKHTHLHIPYLNTECSCSDQEAECETCQRLKARQQFRTRTKEDIAESFNALQVTTDTVPHRTISCRQQEAAYNNYSAQYTLDDTTVDELAGYLENMMYLPKPMSEMAELMYT